MNKQKIIREVLDEISQYNFKFYSDGINLIYVIECAIDKTVEELGEKIK